uniref:NADH-ubiquinone oxidoreductase chain 2 n=1 Tax=Hyalopeplus sp. TaxID=2931294 RepID=A0A8T9ZZV5_9HEMI|nr:NADH dehydrogenase subunit 2 [Hyalopeplus sp.]
MNTSSKMLFMMMTIMSTMMVLSSQDWLNMWIGMEINLMSFIPFMFKNKNNYLSQSSMMYFLMQSLASIIFIMMILLNNYMFIMKMNNWEMNVIMMTMMMKMGMPPFHMWFPEIMTKISWKLCMMLMTWQKVAPLYILSMIMENNLFMMSMTLLSTIIGAIMGLNHTSTRKIMAYSSINHMGWMVACMMMNKKMWMMYLIMYSVMVILTSMLMNKHNIMFINQFNMTNMSMMEKTSLLIMMLSMGGMPPFLGFIPKWMTIKYMIMSNETLLLLMMMMASLVTMSYYMRMMSSMILMTSHSQKWMININKNNKLTPSIMFINMSLPMLIFMFNL